MDTTPPKRWRRLLVRLGWIFTVASAVLTWFERGAEWLSGQKIGAFAQAADKVASWYGEIPVLGSEKFQTYSGIAAAIAFFGTICLWFADRLFFRDQDVIDKRSAPPLLETQPNDKPLISASQAGKQLMSLLTKREKRALFLGEPLPAKGALPKTKVESESEKLNRTLKRSELLARGGLSGARILLADLIESIPSTANGFGRGWEHWLNSAEALLTSLVKTRPKNECMKFLREVKREQFDFVFRFPKDTVGNYLQGFMNNLKQDDLR